MFKLLQLAMSISPTAVWRIKWGHIRQSVYLSRQGAPLALKDPGDIRSKVTIIIEINQNTHHTMLYAF